MMVASTSSCFPPCLLKMYFLFCLVCIHRVLYFIQWTYNIMWVKLSNPIFPSTKRFILRRAPSLDCYVALSVDSFLFCTYFFCPPTPFYEPTATGHVWADLFPPSLFDLWPHTSSLLPHPLPSLLFLQALLLWRSHTHLGTTQYKGIAQP